MVKQTSPFHQVFAQLWQRRRAVAAAADAATDRLFYEGADSGARAAYIAAHEELVAVSHELANLLAASPVTTDAAPDVAIPQRRAA